MDPVRQMPSVPCDLKFHSLSWIWQGKEKTILKMCQQTQKLNEWVLNATQQQLVDASGLGNLARTMGFVVDRFLVTAFCEHWRRETNTAHFAGFEMTPSLKDVSYMLGLSVTGKVVVGEPQRLSGVRQLCLKYLGKDPGPKNIKSGLIKLAWLRNEFYILPQNPSTDEITYSTRAYLLYLIGCTIFTELLKGFVSSRYLPLLEDFDKIWEYAWGAAALAHLYRGLAIASRPNAKSFSGSATLLTAWIYEYLPVRRPKVQNQNFLSFPCACKWNFGSAHFGPKSKRISKYRKTFGSLQVSDVNWTPYKYIDPSTIPEYCSASENIYHVRRWLISFSIKEIYVPERYARQFGQEQHVPEDVPQWHRARPDMHKDWRLEYAKEIEEIQHMDNTYNSLPFSFKELCSSDFSDKWFTQITHQQIDSFMVVLEGFKKDFPVLSHYLEGQKLPMRVARSLERLSELMKAFLQEKNFPMPKQVSQKRKVLEGMKHTAEGEQISKLAKLHRTEQHPASQSPAHSPECQRIHDNLSEPPIDMDSRGIEHNISRKRSEVSSIFKPPVCSDSSTPPESFDSLERGKKKKRVRKENHVICNSSQFRRSGRLSTQIKQLKNKSGQGADPSNPILL